MCEGSQSSILSDSRRLSWANWTGSCHLEDVGPLIPKAASLLLPQRNPSTVTLLILWHTSANQNRPSPTLTLPPPHPLTLVCLRPLQAESKDEAEKPSESAEKSGGDKTEAADKVKKEGGEASEREEEESEEGGEAKSSAPSGNC